VRLRQRETIQVLLRAIDRREEVRQPIDGRFVQRWRNYEKFIQPLLPLLQSNSE